MIINKNISGYVISTESSLQEALAKINQNKHRIGFLVDEQNLLVGSLSDGDVRRWLLNNRNIDLNVPLSGIANQPCFSLPLDTRTEKISNAFNEHIIAIPLTDACGHLVAVAESKASYFEIAGRRISDLDPAFIIAEIGNNHQGDLALAMQLVDSAVMAGVDCIKFQMRNLNQLYRNNGVSTDASADLGAQYTLDLLSKYQLNDDDLFEVFDYCKSQGVLPLCTPWDLDSLSKLEVYGMPGYKLASADFTNYELLDAVAKTGKLMFCSTGMSSEDEIHATVGFLRRKNAQFILLHCNSTYPTPYKDVNLSYISTLRSTSKSFVGYSGHERGWSVPLAAVALGAKVIEKHLTIDKSLEGNDHKVSLLPDEFKQMVEQIRQVEEAIGSPEPRQLTQGEMINREVLAKSLVVNCSLNIGDVIKKEMIDIKSPGQGLQPNRLDGLVGKKATRNFSPGDFFYESDLTGDFSRKEQYSFDRPYGIPVRYHDFVKLTEGVRLDFVEFHLSYRDLELDVTDYVSFNDQIGFAVHAPELFHGDHLLDLSSTDDTYRARSIEELERVIAHTESLKKFFPLTEKPVVVLNAGGWNVGGFLDSSIKNKKYELIRRSLELINHSGVILAIQTMPPFPWHFGGQSYHNLFIDPNEINQFCNATGLKICLDISHSMMACNYYGWDLEEFVETVGPHIAHLHIVDAKGSDGEGVQIGEGDVDFYKLAHTLNEVAPSVQFIPEVWQGHKNYGQGFWSALSYLENVFASV